MNSVIPLYYRIANHLRNRIMAGVYKSGEKIPTENELCDEFSTSRITIRQALRILETQGMLIRKQGVGTLVNKQIKLQPISFNGYVEDIVFQLLPARVIQYHKRETKAPPDIKELLRLHDHEDIVMELQRVRAIDNEINSYALNYLPLDIGRNIEENLLDQHSLIELVDQGESSVHEATQSIRAIAADKIVAKNLKIALGDPVLFSEYIMVDKDQHPINIARVYYHAERYQYTVKMGRLTNDNN